MSDYAIKLATFGRHEVMNSIPSLGTVKGGNVASFADLEGKTVRCSSGWLWITLENDVMDHVLRAEQSFTIPAMGKVIVGGKGCYTIDQAKQMPLAS